jgi:hypothetical protein
MRADIGFLLIGLGLGGVYLVLSGKFPPPRTLVPGSSGSTGGGQSSAGSAGVSYMSAFRLHKVSNGGMR